jgi:hypothetical protein
MTKLFVLGSLVAGTFGGVAMQNEEIREDVSNLYQRARQHVVVRARHNFVDSVREEGYPYPPQDVLDQLSDDQEALVMTTIDQINATYDWANMTDEELQIALTEVRGEMNDLFVELGIDPALIREQVRDHIQDRVHDFMLNRIKEDGIRYPGDYVLSQLTEDQLAEITALIDSYNATYDWANMTDDEIITALQDFRDEMAALKDSLGIDFPLVNAPQDNARGHRRGYGRFEDAPQYEITPEELPDGDNA